MEKRIVVVQNAFKDLKITEQSIMSIRYAAHRWNANFYEITHFQFPNSPSTIMWDRMWAVENFLDYDKVLILDPDVVVNTESPDIFNELTNEYDLCAVLDGNPGRFQTDYGRNNIVKYISEIHNSIELFNKYIPNFDKDRYWDMYFNNGVFLFRPKKLYDVVQKMKQLIMNNNDIHHYIDYSIVGDTFPCQNLFNAMISNDSNINIKLLHNMWNWTSPDVVEEYNENFFLSEKMIPYIYHFTGTNLAKERLRDYTKWNQIN